MNKKNIIFIIVAILFVLGLVAALFFFLSGEEPDEAPGIRPGTDGGTPSAFPPSGTPPPPPYSSDQEEDTLLIPAREGDVEVRNVLKFSSEQYDWGVVVARSDAYTIVYYPEDFVFSIVIEDPDIQKSREEAEARLLLELNIEKLEACKLTVDVAVPVGLSPEHAGVNYGLSFCPRP
ncbi:hypothetical protein L0Y49_00275 [bacterium]|nr:hypothetical protein [bacterium]MCI0566514.1 hypothetical protein [bacterium]